MRVVITGGTGLIGQALTAELVKDDHEVIVLSRNPTKTKGLPAHSTDCAMGRPHHPRLGRTH